MGTDDCFFATKALDYNKLWSLSESFFVTTEGYLHQIKLASKHITNNTDHHSFNTSGYWELYRTISSLQLKLASKNLSFIFHSGGGMTPRKFIQPPIPAPHLSPPKCRPILRTMKLDMASNSWCSIRFSKVPIGGFRCIKAAAQNLACHGDDVDNEKETYKKTLPQIKEDLISSLQDINRGIFGVPSEKRNEIENLVELLESYNPNPQPTLRLEKVGGEWKLIYSTITILGSKRTKLGLRDFINLGDFIQYISVAEGKAVNVIQFTARGLSLLSGQLTIDASFNIASHSRVDITYNKSAITPDQLMNVFRKNYDLLLGIFNPQGWLEITFVDDVLRVGRDDKGNIFILQRVVEEDKRSS